MVENMEVVVGIASHKQFASAVSVGCCRGQASGSLKSGATMESGSSDDLKVLPSSAIGKSIASSSSAFKSMASFGTTQQQIFSDIGYYRGVLVALKHIRKEHIQLSRLVLLEFNEVRLLLRSIAS